MVGAPLVFLPLGTVVLDTGALSRGLRWSALTLGVIVFAFGFLVVAARCSTSSARQPACSTEFQAGPARWCNWPPSRPAPPDPQGRVVMVRERDIAVGLVLPEHLDPAAVPQDLVPRGARQVPPLRGRQGRGMLLDPGPSSDCCWPRRCRSRCPPPASGSRTGRGLSCSAPVLSCSSTHSVVLLCALLSRFGHVDCSRRLCCRYHGGAPVGHVARWP